MFGKFGSIVVAALVFAGVASASPPSTLTPVVSAARIAVPADVVAAHPGGTSGLVDAVAVSSTLKLGGGTSIAAFGRTCWRAWFTGDNSLAVFGTEQEHANPYWCGSGGVTRGVDSSYHYPVCTWLVSCQGESGPFTWGGCANGCSSIGQQVIGHFQVYAGIPVSVDIVVLYELYGNGQYWDYEYHT